ncbi:MAG: hypothetical protein ABW352_19615 [Polyangiales bacterium]
MRARWLPSILCGVLGGLGCGDEREDERSPEVGPPIDAGARDAGMDARAALPTAPPACLGARRAFALGESAARSFSAVLEGDRVHLAMIAPECAFEQGLRYLNFLSEGDDAGTALDVDRADCLPVREPTLLAHGERELLLYFGSKRTSRFDLYETTPSQPMRAWTRRTNDQGEERALVTAALGPTRAPTLAYATDGMLQLQGRELGPSGVVSLALARREDGLQQGRGVLGWAGEGGVSLRSLRDTGELSGEPVKIGEAGGALAFASRAETTGVFYVDGPLRYRALGAELAAPVTIASQPVRALAAAPYRNGFAVAYRDDLGLHARTVSVEGRVLGEATLTREPGRDVQLLSSAGTLIAIWDEPAADAGLARSLQVATVDCL